MKSATEKGIITYCWDTGGIFNFTTGKVIEKVVLNAIMQGAKDATTTTGITALNDSEIKLYPNPFTSTINLKVGNPDKIMSISIFDTMGRQVEVIGHSAINSSVAFGSSLDPNIYLVKVYGADWTKTFKVVKH
jgi:hypothetical protein